MVTGSLVNIVLGASHNVLEKPPEQVDKKIKKKAAGYTNDGLMASYKFQRVKGPRDENKFLLPMYGNHVSSLAVQLIRLALKGCRVSVVGSKEVGIYVNLIKEYFDESHSIDSDKIIFTYEGNIKDLKLSNTIRKGRDALGAPEKYIFMPADVPLANLDDVIQRYNSFEIDNHEFSLNLNAKIELPEYGELFTRNYYYTVDDKLIKEPNDFFFSKNFENWELVDSMYGARHKWGMAWFVLKNMTKLLSDSNTRPMASKLLPQLLLLFQNKLLGKKDIARPEISLEELTTLVDKVSGYRTKITLNDSDPFLVKDIDAWHDWAYYHLLFSKLENYGGVTALFDDKTADAITGFDRFMAEKRDDYESQLHLVYHSLDYAETRARELDIKEYFDTENNFRLVKRDDEKIKESIEYLLAA